MVKHILRDGTELKDITGHKVTKEDAPMVYQIIEQMQRKESKEWESHMKI